MKINKSEKKSTEKKVYVFFKSSCCTIMTVHRHTFKRIFQHFSQRRFFFAHEFSNLDYCYFLFSTSRAHAYTTTGRIRRSCAHARPTPKETHATCMCLSARHCFLTCVCVCVWYVALEINIKICISDRLSEKRIKETPKYTASTSTRTVCWVVLLTGHLRAHNPSHTRPITIIFSDACTVFISYYQN